MIKSNMHNKLTTIKKVIWVITPFLLLTILIILLFRGCNTKRVEGKDIVVDGVIVKQPTNNCRAHFSGTFLSDEEEYGNISIIYQTDDFSEYVGEGKYPRGKAAFPKADSTSFDAIAIDQGTQVIIYSEENFKGEILLDEKGPVIIINTHRYTEYSVVMEEILTKKLKEPLNTNFPPSCRKMSKSNMFDWSKGSLKVICNE
jgi:hypothetical protein